VTLVEFLRARLDEDEQVARAVEPDTDVDVPYTSQAAQAAQYAFLKRFGPARVLAEVDAKRRLIAKYEHYDASARYPDSEGGMAMGLEAAVEFAALPYAAHPDYREEWRP
jgi:hypothetical protein